MPEQTRERSLKSLAFNALPGWLLAGCWAWYIIDNPPGRSAPVGSIVLFLLGWLVVFLAPVANEPKSNLPPELKWVASPSNYIRFDREWIDTHSAIAGQSPMLMRAMTWGPWLSFLGLFVFLVLHIVYVELT